MPGQVYTSSSQLVKLRKQQLLDLARAYEIPVEFSLSKSKILRIMEAEEDRGTFLRPPKNDYYFQKARFTADQVRDARSNGGYTKEGIPVTFLFPWTGPNPDPAPAKPTASEVRKVLNEKQAQRSSRISMLRQECKARGLNSFGKKADVLAQMIAEHDGKVQKTEN